MWGRGICRGLACEAGGRFRAWEVECSVEHGAEWGLWEHLVSQSPHKVCRENGSGGPEVTRRVNGSGTRRKPHSRSNHVQSSSLPPPLDRARRLHTGPAGSSLHRRLHLESILNNVESRGNGTARASAIKEKQSRAQLRMVLMVRDAWSWMKRRTAKV
jgi:hypothetical protein